MRNHDQRSAGVDSPHDLLPRGEAVRSLGVQALLWVALVGLAAVGRIWQPAWNVTPLAGAAVAAGMIFPSVVVAASVPLAALVISNLALPAYDNLALAAVVFAATAWPVILGHRGLLGAAGQPRMLAVAGAGLANSLVFFFSTNIAHWLFTADYPRSAAGLGECLVAALPFYRWMPLGDAGWSVAIAAAVAVLLGAIDAATLRRLRPQAVSSRPLD
jgi:hypothetical protein